MSYFKNYSFEYNAQRVDLFNSTIVCSYQDEVDDFIEGTPINIDVASFYGVVTSCKNSGEKLSLLITAESWGRELRNTAVTEYVEFRQADIIRIIKDHLIPASWDFVYPSEFDLSPRFISYILRNGNYLSHISTLLDALGLDYTIYSTFELNIVKKYVKAFYRDNFDDRTVFIGIERINIGNLNITADYGKVATSIVVTGAESEQGTNQSYMDAEIGNWHEAPRAISIRDTILKKPEFAADSMYFWYFPASVASPETDILVSGDIVTIDTDRIKIDSVWFLSSVDVSSWESGDLLESDFPTHLQDISNYVASGVIVASVVSSSFSDYLYSVDKTVTITNGRNVSEFGTDPGIHAIYDDILISSAIISVSSYLTFGKNLPASNGIIWFGSERSFYRSCTNNLNGTYTVNGLIRGIPTCAVASCEHCGTYLDRLRPVGWAHGCIFGGFDDGESISKYCTLAADIKSKFSITSNIEQCPLVFDAESVCPLRKCPLVKNGIQFAQICPKGLTRDELNLSLTSRYQHHKACIVFPGSYYSLVNGVDTYSIYADDSLIHKYGYLPTRVQVKGIADIDGLDKIAEGRLRLSAIPIVGKFTLLEYDPWVVNASCFPGDVVQIETASHGRYDFTDQRWYPTYWFDTSSYDMSNNPDWLEVASGTRWVKFREKFVIQKVVKNQRGYPEISFGAGDIGFADVTDYITDTLDTTSQRHRNQDMSKIIGQSETGLAAQVQNLLTGAITWVRMIR